MSYNYQSELIKFKNTNIIAHANVNKGILKFNYYSYIFCLITLSFFSYADSFIYLCYFPYNLYFISR